MCGRRPHNLGVGPVKSQILVELPAPGVADFAGLQPLGQKGEQPLAVFCAVGTPQLILGDIEADEPVPQGQADADKNRRAAAKRLVREGD